MLNILWKIKQGTQNIHINIYFGQKFLTYMCLGDLKEEDKEKK